jgi:hypothetical protein
MGGNYGPTDRYLVYSKNKIWTLQYHGDFSANLNEVKGVSISSLLFGENKDLLKSKTQS